MVPVPWLITGLSISNIRHGTGGFWSFNISDTPTLAPQGFNTTCNYQSAAAYFAVSEPPINAPCANPNVTFGLFPDTNAHDFVFNVTHVWWGSCGGTDSCGSAPKRCIDNGTWIFSWDDVMGEENDVQNNFGQAGSFFHLPFQIYPTRSVPSQKCEFC
ncbi:hypothetical protein NA56DRAFT_577254 [Hyaloscypha hepaticicola]|uniref:Uncharacterized protein n=1 Tax=Hyaloscypha hepaticicola TaxID=2082293 RepID=A0A2J6PW17_9HELO|nr:hypothetical protein NA56DRAFT_577254 [Hyaloscypha hepaticicola]